MSKQVKITVGIIIVLLIILAIFGFSKSSAPVEAGPIKIGYVGALTGEGAPFGETEKNATELAVEEINANGGINGRMLEVIYEDGKCSAKDAISAIQKLISVDGVKIVLGGTCSSESLAMIPIAEENNILLLSGFSSSPELSGISPLFLRNAPQDSDVAEFDAKVMSSKYKKIALISENAEYSIGVRTIMQKVFEDEGVSLVVDELYNSSVTDFKSILTKVKNTDAEVLYMNPATSTKMGGIMVKQARELGITLPIHGNFSLATPEAIEAGGAHMEGVISTDGTGLVEKGEQVLSSYVAKIGAQPTNEYLMGSNYDRPFLIVQAIEKVGLDAEKISNYLRNIKNFDGAIGRYHFDENGDVVGVGVMSVIIQNGEKVPYSQ